MRMMNRIVTLSVRRQAFRPIRCFAAPAKKYISIYNDASKVQYPVELLGGSHVEFAKLLYAFADQVESKNFDLYINEFNKLDEIIAKVGPFWAEAKILESKEFNSLNPGFSFVLAWMQNEGMVDMLPYVRSSYKELANEATKTLTVTITVAKEGDDLSAAKKEAQAMHAASENSSYSLRYETKYDPALVGGYTVEVGSYYVNKSSATASAAAAGAAASALAFDWTALPASAPRATPIADDMLVQLLGATVDDLMEADKAELKFGA